MGNLLIREQAHIYADPTDQLPRTLLLLLQQQVQLVLAHEAQVNENLTNLPKSHLLFASR